VAIRAARKAAWPGRVGDGRDESSVAAHADSRRQAREGPDPDEANAVLEAVAGLSDAYRAAVVLCELERSVASR